MIIMNHLTKSTYHEFFAAIDRSDWIQWFISAFIKTLMKNDLMYDRKSSSSVFILMSISRLDQICTTFDYKSSEDFKRLCSHYVIKKTLTTQQSSQQKDKEELMLEIISSMKKFRHKWLCVERNKASIAKCKFYHAERVKESRSSVIILEKFEDEKVIILLMSLELISSSDRSAMQESQDTFMKWSYNDFRHDIDSSQLEQEDESLSVEILFNVLNA